MSDSGNMYYSLGNSTEEHQRLMLQSRFLGELTESYFARAGLAPGMNVLDIGCGTGDVSFVASAFVGPEGSVLGVDQSEEAVAVARERAGEAGVSNVRFETGDVASPDSIAPGETFDALVGRLILLYLADPGATLAALASRVRAGGPIVMQEFDMTLAGSCPEVPLADQCTRWISTAFERVGLDARLGTRIHSVFTDGGLPRPATLGGVRVESGEESGAYEWIAETLRTVLPLLEQTGVATEDDIGLDTLADRLRRETVAADAALHSPMLVGAWVNRPA